MSSSTSRGLSGNPDISIRLSGENKKPDLSRSRKLLEKNISEQIALKDPRALSAICDLIGLSKIVLYIYYLLRDQFDIDNMFLAEDLASETLINVWQTFDIERGSLKYWIYRQAKQSVFKFLRETRAEHKYLSNFFQAENTDISDIDIIAVEKVKRILENLPDENRQIIIMKLYYDMKFREIAVEMSKPESTIKSQYYRDLDTIRNTLQFSDYLTK